MSLKLRPSLELKVFFSLAAFYLAAVSVLTYLTVRSQKNLLVAEMAEKAKAGVNLMELSVTAPLYKLDITRLETIAREAQAHANVEYAYIYGPEGRIVGDFHEDKRDLFATFPDQLGQRITEFRETVVNMNHKEGILDIINPILLGHQHLGGIRIGFNLEPMLAEIRLATFRHVGFASAIFLLGLFAIFVIVKRMMRPIQELTTGVKRIEEGDYQYRVSLQRSDELGILAKTFNQMADQLMRRENELKQSQNIIRRADRLASLGQLTAGLAHEIRNPLVAIRTFTQLLPQRYQDPEFRNSFQALAMKEVDRICGLVNDLLSFARPSAPNVSTESINEIVESIARILETEAKEKGVQIYRRLAPSLPKIFVDKEQIKQVCMNVILNGIQAIDGKGVVQISTQLFAKNGDEQFVQIGVRDSGAGISDKDLENIFNPFFTTKKEGSGLGLSISHQIVQEHGGYIVVESRVGDGTTFFINLPVAYRAHQGVKGRPQLHEEDPGR